MSVPYRTCEEPVPFDACGSRVTGEARVMTTMEQKARWPTRVLRLRDALARTGLSRSTVYVPLDRKRFPRPVSLGARAVGWIDEVVDEWMRERIVASRGGDTQAK